MILDWNKLITSKRLGTSAPNLQADARNEFERDVDRIIFSSAFRRLQDKTQVFPIPKSDFIHSRLTHSIEVASVGRSLGKLIGKLILKNEGLIKDSHTGEEINPETFSNIIAAACMCHDIGNPPFGHSGEDAFRNYFENYQNNSSKELFEKLDKSEKEDFLRFEGNAEGFRILTNDHPSGYPGGLKMTYTTLAAFSKYTCEAGKLKLNKLGNSVYNNVNQVGLFSDALLKFSRETGQPFSKVLQEFGTYSDRFITAISSDKATQSFATLELLARRSGASVDKLVSSISKFDDIDEAFSTGGQLNRVLSYFGGSFDTLAAANASDEERAKMLLESISSISDKFSEVSNPQARRSMLKEIERSSGLPMETITGLLNKNNRLSEDLTAIMRTPVEVKPSEISYTQEQKKAMAMELTDMATINRIYEESIKMGLTISTIEKIFSANKKTNKVLQIL